MLSATFTLVKGLSMFTYLIVYTRLGKLRGIIPLIPGLDEGLGVLWNGQVQAVHTWLEMFVLRSAARTCVGSLLFIYRSIKVSEV